MSRFTPAIAAFTFLVAVAVSAAGQIIPLPVTLNGQTAGEVNANVEGDQLMALDVAPIRSQLQALLAPEYFARIPTNSAGPVPVTLLDAAGIQTRFNFEELSVALTIPVNLRRLQSDSLLGTPNIRAVKTYAPAAFSAYMNVRGGVNYSESGATASAGFDQPQLALENAFNLDHLVLENETDINPSPTQSWQKRDTRLVYDLPEPRLRVTAGDLDYPVAGFQGFIPMLGLSLNREDSLQPFRVTSPLGQSAFFLQADSKVDVIINGNVVQTMQLGAGPHQINNFPLTGGANTVILRITDPVGRIQYINARLFYDPGLLKAGESEFNYAIGFPSITDPNSPYYRYSSRPVASAYHRWGLTDQITAGFNGQGSTDTQLGGAEIVFSSVAGTFDLDSAFSHDRWIGDGAAQRIQYHYYAPHQGLFADGQFTLAAQNQNAHYTPPTPFTTPAAHGSLWNYSAQYSQRLGERWFAGAGYSYQVNGDGTRLGTASLIGGYHASRVYADVTVDENTGSASQGQWTAFFSLRIDLEHGQNLFSTYDTATHTSRTEWQYTPPANVESVNATVGLQNTPGQNDYYGNVYYAGRRAELTLNQDDLSTGGDLTSLRWGTALVYADGVFGISRPVEDSFAIFQSLGSLQEDGGVGVQPQARLYQAQEDWLGPAVMPQLTGYYPMHITVEPRRPEADFDPQDGDILLLPTYRSGTLVRLGHLPTIDATVKLTWADGQPLNCVDGNLADSGGKSVEFISNRDGVVYLSGLTPGNYSATISGYPDATFPIIIPVTSARQMDLGVIKLSVKP